MSFYLTPYPCIFKFFITLFFILYLILPMSSFPNKLGISPIVKIVLISSTNDSSVIWLSENMNTIGIYLKAQNYMLYYLIFSRKSFSLNDLETERWSKLYLAIKVASLVNECLPDPPSPTNIPWPLLNLMTLLILQTYEMASSNRVIFIAAALNA